MRQIAILPGLEGASDVLTFTLDGRTLITSGTSGRIALWDVATRVPRVTLTRRRLCRGGGSGA